MNNQQLNLRAAELRFLEGKTKEQLEKGEHEFWTHQFNPCENWKDAGLLLEEMLGAGFDVTFMRNKLGVQYFDGEVNREYTNESYLVNITQCYIAWKEDKND